MSRKTKVIEQIEARMEGIEAGSLRYEVLDCAKQFKTYWIELGRSLYTVWKDKLYRGWGYISFEAYCAKEIGIRHATASKLLKSYCFLEREEPHFLKREYVETHRPSDLPSLETVNLLRLAKQNKKVDESDYGVLREKALEKGSEAPEVRSTLRGFIESAGGEDPEEIYKRRRLGNLKRLVTMLKQVTKEAEYASMLPKSVINDAGRLVSKIEGEIGR